MNPICYFCKSLKQQSGKEPYCYEAGIVHHEGGYGSHYTPNCVHDEILKDYFQPIEPMKKAKCGIMNKALDNPRNKSRRLNFKIPEIYGHKINIICDKTMTTFLKDSIDKEFNKIIDKL